MNSLDCFLKGQSHSCYRFEFWVKFKVTVSHVFWTGESLILKLKSWNLICCCKKFCARSFDGYTKVSVSILSEFMLFIPIYSQDIMLLEHQTCDHKVVSSSPGSSDRRVFFSRVQTLIRCPFHPRVTAEARKRHRSFCQSAGDRLHLNTHALLTQRNRSGLTMLSMQA